MEGHPVMEREHMRVHEENKTQAGKVRWVRLDEGGDGRTKMGMNPDTCMDKAWTGNPAVQQASYRRCSVLHSRTIILMNIVMN